MSGATQPLPPHRPFLWAPGGIAGQAGRPPHPQGLETEPKDPWWGCPVHPHNGSRAESWGALFSPIPSCPGAQQLCSLLSGLPSNLCPAGAWPHCPTTGPLPPQQGLTQSRSRDCVLSDASLTCTEKQGRESKRRERGSCMGLLPPRPQGWQLGEPPLAPGPPSAWSTHHSRHSGALIRIGSVGRERV